MTNYDSLENDIRKNEEQLKMEQGIVMDRDAIIELTGSTEGGWDWVEDWFSGKSQGEILAECNRTWPGEDNEYLAYSIHGQLN